VVSARAIGILLYLASNPLQGGARALTEVFTEGRDACQKALTELKKAGLAHTVTYRFSGGWVREIVLTEAGWAVLETRIGLCLESRTSIQQNVQNSRLTLIANSINKLTESTDPVREDYPNQIEIGVKPMSDTFPDYDDMDNYRRKMREKKQAEYNEERTQVMAQRMKVRSQNNKADWSPTDSAMEFASRVHNMWHIKPWRVTQSRFIFALANFRKTHETNGEIECLMMDVFFASIEHDTELDDAEKMWRMFIKRAPGMVADAKRKVYLPDTMVNAQVEADKSWEDILDV
jgi:hypothetical protein